MDAVGSTVPRNQFLEKRIPLLSSTFSTATCFVEDLEQILFSFAEAAAQQSPPYQLCILNRLLQGCAVVGDQHDMPLSALHVVGSENLSHLNVN